jgi:hypothetical protein
MARIEVPTVKRIVVVLTGMNNILYPDKQTSMLCPSDIVEDTTHIDTLSVENLIQIYSVPVVIS